MNRSEIYEMLKTLKYDAREKLKFTEQKIKVTNANLESELRIRRKLMKTWHSLKIKEKFYKKKIYVLNRKMEKVVFGSKPTKITKTFSRSQSHSKVQEQTSKLCNNRAEKEP